MSDKNIEDAELVAYAGIGAQAALVASGHAFSVCDVRQPDFPLSWVNPAFEQLTGYSFEQVVGRNCRFMQGPDTDPVATARIRAALESGVAVTETLLNYYPDGTGWWNQITITPVLDEIGAVTHFVGVQSNADERVTAARERDHAIAEYQRIDAALYAREHALALALQRSLLPALPTVAGLELAARYVPASETAEVGGDWYDVLPLPDGSTGIAIGDVMGHDTRAAGAMGQLRSVLRSYAWEGYGPAEVLDRLNQLVLGLGMAQLATCFYARLEPGKNGGPAVLRWANAGHPAPMLMTPDGVVQYLEDARGILIGVGSDAPAMHERSSSAREIPAGSTLLFYTDGVVEDRVHDVDEGIAALRDVFVRGDRSQSVDAIADAAVTARDGARHDDDRCVLIVRVLA